MRQMQSNNSSYVCRIP